MKKFAALLSVFFIFGVFFLVGCDDDTSSEKTPDDTQEQEQEEQEQLRLADGNYEFKNLAVGMGGIELQIDSFSDIPSELAEMPDEALQFFEVLKSIKFDVKSEAVIVPITETIHINIGFDIQDNAVAFPDFENIKLLIASDPELFEEAAEMLSVIEEFEVYSDMVTIRIKNSGIQIMVELEEFSVYCNFQLKA